MLYYSTEKATKDQIAMNDYHTNRYNDLKEGVQREYCVKDYAKYFMSVKRKKRSMHYTTRRCNARRSKKLWLLCPAIK